MRLNDRPVSNVPRSQHNKCGWLIFIMFSTYWLAGVRILTGKSHVFFVPVTPVTSKVKIFFFLFWVMKIYTLSAVTREAHNVLGNFYFIHLDMISSHRYSRRLWVQTPRLPYPVAQIGNSTVDIVSSLISILFTYWLTTYKSFKGKPAWSHFRILFSATVISQGICKSFLPSRSCCLVQEQHTIRNFGKPR